ncbi:MAG: PAS domain S-box protein [Myxococcota bacterium]
MFVIPCSVIFFFGKKSSIASISAVLEENGFEVRSQAISGGTYKKVYDKIPHLIFLENALFQDANASVLHQINQDYPGVPRISVISRGEENSVESLISWGVDDFIYRDSSVPDILARIKTNLQPRQRNITEEKALNDKILEKNKYDQLRTEFWKFAFLSENETVLLDNLLSRLGEYLDLDRVSFLKFNSEAKQWECIEQWINNPSREEVKRCELPFWFVRKISHDDYYEVTDEELCQLQEELPDYFWGIKNLLIIAYGGGQEPLGFFLLEDFRNKEKRKSQDIKIAKDLSNIVKLKAEALESNKILQRSEEKFRIISETSRDLVCVHNREGSFTYVSPSSKEMLGYTPQELLGFNPYGMIHSDDAGDLEEQFNQLISSTLTGGKNEYRIKRKDGQFVWFETIIQPIRDKNGEVIELQSSSRDITERKLAEQQIREKEEKYRNIFESMFDVYVEVDIDTWAILEISPSVKRISGFTREELLGHSILQLYAKPAEGRQLLDILRKKEKISDFEVTMLNKNGGEVICSYSVRMIKDSNGWPKRMVGTLRDISERKRAERQLEEAKQRAESASKAKSEFLANMSHEIRTPMNAILGFSEVLMNKTNDEEKKSHLEAILSSGRTLLSLINDILDLSKIEAGKMQINYEPVELPVLIEDIEHIFEKKLKEKDLALKIDIDSELPTVLLLDEMRIRQILFNLVGNAIKFTDRGYIKIIVHARETEADCYELILIVKDTGVGIPRKQQKLIFNAFQQQDGQDTRRYEGSGLGLSITKKLVEKMKGKIKLDSRIGQGSCFEIILPDIEKGEPQETSYHRETTDQTNVTFKPATILIVDDIQYNIDAIKNFLDSTNLAFAEAQNAEKALEIIKITPPDIVLMDLKLPDMSGYEATALIKSNKKLQGIPVLAFTASAMASDETEAKTLFNDFITKPISKNELYGKLKRFLPHKPKIAEKKVKRKNTAVNKTIAKGDFKELRGRLESDLMEDWEEIKENLVIYKIEDFLEKLRQLNQAFDIEPLENYYTELKTYLHKFDIENMEHKIKEFPQLVEKIKGV